MISKELAELVAEAKLTEVNRAEFLAILTEADQEFAKLAERQRPTQEFLNRSYTI